MLERVRSSKGAVVFLPSVGWGIHLFQRPHHLARVFARLGYVAIFDSSNAADRVDGFREIEPNLFLFSGCRSSSTRSRRRCSGRFPYNFHLADGYPRPARTVYDWIDDLSVFPYRTGPCSRANHARGLAEATVVASVARRLHEEALAVATGRHLPAERRRVRALRRARGAASARRRAPAVSHARRARRRVLRRPGGVVRLSARSTPSRRPRPDWRFVLIGPAVRQEPAAVSRCSSARTSAGSGPRDYVTLPGYLSLFDVATIPFRINAITLATSPLKLYEYFAGARPVVTTPMPECQAYPEVRIAATAEEFTQALDDAREQGRDPNFRAHLRALGRENSWAARVMTVLRALEGR